ncbi:MAG: hypothetical protein A2Y62_14810 [Candidatus Fischerbacteria bacterium RBG_13_37_8]|uniref:Uncharacterized protein n=1 Tax=Candidatus Fischerbacteria bacterium RBG_13_37_8 TaxID=1817863 RepID=A0A1F5VMT9_9BACT|nr:MAG: hypothetical protein A2Y62_14810 [Candidatus Fischerbacteria bacterium RBG_13_37_8]
MQNNINIEDYNGNTALGLYIALNPANRTSDIVTLLKKHGAKLSESDVLSIQYVERRKKNYSIDKNIVEAIEKGDSNEVMKLIEESKNLNKTDKYDNSEALSKALFKKHLEIVKILIEAGTNINRRFSSGETALHYAVRSGDVAIVKDLIKAGAYLNIKEYSTPDVKSGVTPLWIAAAHGRVEIVRELINAGADVTIADDVGETALSIAKSHGYKDVIEEIEKALATLKNEK